MNRLGQSATFFALIAIGLAVAMAPICSQAASPNTIDASSNNNIDLLDWQGWLRRMGANRNLVDKFDLMLLPSMGHETVSQLPESSARHHLGVAIKEVGHKLNLPLDDFVDKAEVIFYSCLENFIKILNYGLLIYERSVLPDVCFLRSMCYFGTNLSFTRHMIGRISPSALEGSIFMRAITRGILGVNCEDSFVCPNKPGAQGSFGPGATGTLEAVKNPIV